MAKPELIKKWDNWSAGLGFQADDGRTPGWHFGVGIRGSIGCLAPSRATEYAIVAHEVLTDAIPIVNFAAGMTDGAYAAVSFMSDAPLTATTRGSVTTTTATNTDTNTTVAYATPAGTDVLVICLMWNDSRTVTSIDYGAIDIAGGEIDLQASGITAGAFRAAIYTVNDSDDAGEFDGVAQNLVVVFSGTCDSVVSLFVMNATAFQTAISTHDSDGSLVTVAAAGASIGSGKTLNAFRSGHMIIAFATNDVANTASSFTFVLEDGVSDTLNANILERIPATATVGATGATSYFSYQYFLEENASQSMFTPFLYAIRGRRNTTTSSNPYKTFMEKFDTYGTEILQEAGSHAMDPVNGPGQPARYQGSWYFPAGNNFKPYKLTVGSASAMNDTLSATASGFVAGADHYAMVGHQLGGAVEDGTRNGGIRILAIDGDPTTDASWGGDYAAGDNGLRPLGLASVEGLSFLLNRDGLYSFTSSAYTGTVFEDLRGWREILANIHMKSYKGGLLIPHTSGLLYYTPGSQPINVGIDRLLKLQSPSNALTTQFTGGRYHSIAVAGDYVYAIYQPNQYSRAAYVLCGYMIDSPTELAWIVMDSITLNQAGFGVNVFVQDTGIGVTLASWIVASQFQPAVVYSVNGDLAYIRLDQNGGPFDHPNSTTTYTPRSTANAWMSELFFEQEMKLDRIVIYTANLEAGNDSVVLSRSVDVDTLERTIGASVVANGRNVRDLGGLICNRFQLNVAFACATSHTELPMIKRIELWGSPVVGDRG